MVHPQIWDPVPDKDVHPAIYVANIGRGAQSQSQTKVTQEDKVALIGIEERAIRVKMVDPFPEPVSLSNTSSIGSKLISSTGRVMGK